LYLAKQLLTHDFTQQPLLSLSQTLSGWRVAANRAMLLRDAGSLQAHWLDGLDLIRSRAALEAEIWVLRQQINVLRRTAPKKLSFSPIDRLIFVGLYRLFPKRLTRN
jgi:hypothetical protein